MREKLQKLALSGLGISLIAGIILAILAPYHTGEFPFSFRLAYWTILSFIGGLGAAAFRPLARKLGWMPSTTIVMLGQSITAAIAVTLCLIALDVFRTGSISLIGIAVLFGFVWVISIVISGIAHLAERGSKPDITNNNRAAIFERLKPKLRQSEIYALSAEDHYVRIITSKGEELILMRLSDAVKELGGLSGLQVHRSWWVAEAGVKAAKKSDGKISLELHSGQTAPVSRANNKIVRSAGWA